MGSPGEHSSDPACREAVSLQEQLRLARVDGGAFLLPSRLMVRLSGRDAFRYLNGQVTRDLTRLREGESLAACLLTPKGKLCAPLLIRREEDAVLVEAEPLLEAALMARLDRYIVADEVTLSVEPPRETIHFFGAKASDAKFEGSRVSRLGVPGLDAAPAAIPEQLTDSRVIETLRIERGIARWGSEMNEEILPPEVGLDRTHIDYDRGCYPGQETISRLKSIGRVRRLLHTLLSSPGQELHAGMRVIDREKKEVGTIGSAAEQFDSTAWVALAILPRESMGPLFAFDPLTGETTPITIMQIHGS